MTTINNTLEEMRKRNPLNSIEALIMADQPVTQADMDRIQAEQAKQYQNRDKMPETYLVYCDAYVQLCGKDKDGNWNQEPTKRVLMDWMQTFEEWKQEHLKPEHIQAAFIKANSDQGFPVGRPGALTVTAIAIKTKIGTTATPQINTEAIDATLQAANAKWNVENFQPVTQETREAARARLKAKFAEIDTKREAERRNR